MMIVQIVKNAVQTGVVKNAQVFKKSSSDKKYCLEEIFFVVVPSQDVITTRSSLVRRQNRLFDQFLALLKKNCLNLLDMIFKPHNFWPHKKMSSDKSPTVEKVAEQQKRLESLSNTIWLFFK